MAETRHEELRQLFDMAMATPADERGALLDVKCRGDSELRQRIEIMIRGAEQAGAQPSSPTADFSPASSSDDSPTMHDAGGTTARLIEGPGTRIGPYKLLQPIGEGGFGSVFMAEQQQPVVRKVALKIIKLGMDTRQVVARFEQERQALAMMDHPNIARVLDAGATETGRPYFVMDLVKGDPIVVYCDRNNLRIEERLELFAQVCQAVQHAHSKGIIHRDIKPSNILVSTQDGKPSAKVIDFGIAKATASKLTEKTLFTEHRQLIGTPEYMSPEQAEGSMDIDTRSDIYSLGVLLYELLTGSTPFDGKSLRSAAFGELQRIIREVDPPNPSTRLSQSTGTIASVAAHRHTEPRKLGTIIRGELDWIVMKALEKDRQRRYETANGLAMDVRRFLSGEAVGAAPPSTAYRFRKLVRRNKGLVTATGAVALALLVGLVAFAWQASVARTQRDLAMAAQASEAEQRREADEQRDRAVLAETETRKRADELAQVSEFQAKMLSQIDPNDAGLMLSADIRGKFARALEKAGVPEADRRMQIEAFVKQLERVNATDAATGMIDQTILKPAIKAVETEFKDQPLVGASLRQTLAELYRMLGRYDEAMVLQNNALATRRRLLGEDHPSTLDSMNAMGTLLESQGKLPEAESYLRKALEGRRRVSGDEHHSTLDVMSNLGNCLRSEGKLAEAEPLLRTALEGKRRVLGSESRSTLSSLDTLGYLLVDQGKLAEAEPYWREAYETGKRVFSADDPDVFVWTNNMGGLLGAIGKPKESEALYREALATSRRVRGEEHPSTLTLMTNVALALTTMGRYPEAEATFREVLAIRRRARGEDHPDTLKSISDVAYVLSEQGRWGEAEPLYRQALAARRIVLGDDNPDTIASINSMGLLLSKQGKRSEAETYYKEALDRRRRLLGEDHPETLFSESNMGALLVEQGKYDEAEVLCRDVLQKRRRLLGDDNPETLVSVNIMGQVYARQSKWAEAEPYWREAMETSKRLRGPEHPDTLVFSNNMGSLLRYQGKYSESELVLREAAEMSSRGLGKEHPTTLTLIANLGGALVAQNKFAPALELLAPTESAVRKRYTGPNARTLGTLLFNLGKCRTGLGEFAAAEANLLEAYPILVQTKGETHKDARECAQALVDLYTAWNTAQPGKGIEAKGAEWSAKLEATKPAPASTPGRPAPKAEEKK